MTAWAVHEWDGSATDFHATVLPAERGLWTLVDPAPTIVLGSSQPEGDIDIAAAALGHVDIVRRRSGGGAVWLGPHSCWFDIVIPAGDPLWVDDVPRSMGWLGRVLAGVIGSGASVVTDPYVATPLARAYCFGGTAPGEVTGSQGKIVGISQRRTRESARFQCVAYAGYDPSAVAGFFSNSDIARQVADTPVMVLDRGIAPFLAAVAGALPG